MHHYYCFFISHLSTIFIRQCIIITAKIMAFSRQSPLEVLGYSWFLTYHSWQAPLEVIWERICQKKTGPNLKTNNVGGWQRKSTGDGHILLLGQVKDIRLKMFNHWCSISILIWYTQHSVSLSVQVQWLLHLVVPHPLDNTMWSIPPSMASSSSYSLCSMGHIYLGIQLESRGSWFSTSWCWSFFILCSTIGRTGIYLMTL